MYKNLLVLPDGTELRSGVGSTNAIKNVKFTNLVNGGEELNIGSVCCSEIEVSAFAPGGGLSLTSGDEVTLYKENPSGDRIRMGIFSIQTPTRPSANTMNFIGYDRISKLDKDLSFWLASLTGWPYTVNEFAALVCSACGITFRANSGIPNADFSIEKWSKGVVTGRQIMRWLGEIVCRFVRATPDGEIEFGWYTESGKTYAPAGSNYYFAGSFSHENYQVTPVDAVQLRMADSESGALWPPVEEGANSYIITGNPILMSSVTEELLPYLEVIQAELEGAMYTPCEVSIPADSTLKAGDIVQITDANGKKVTVYVMTKTNSGQRDTITCTGSYRRDSSGAASHKTGNEKKAEAEANNTFKLTQDNVFNALTNNGEVQGFFLKDGQVYVNVSYLATGILRSKDGTTFYLDLDNNTLKAVFSELSISGKTVDTIAQEKADAAEDNAVGQAVDLANAAEANANQHANSIANQAQTNAQNYADQAASNAVKAQTQVDIFNKLTNNGQDQGIYMVNGKLYINLQYLKAGSFTSSASVFLEPGQEELDTIKAHILGTSTISSSRISLYDFDNSGTIGITDLTKCKQAMLGQISLSSWSGAKKSTVTVTIDASNTAKPIKISGTNMWGRAVEYYIGFSGANIGSIPGSLAVGGKLIVGGSFTPEGAFIGGSKLLYDSLPSVTELEEGQIILVKVG